MAKKNKQIIIDKASDSRVTAILDIRDFPPACVNISDINLRITLKEPCHTRDRGHF